MRLWHYGLIPVLPHKYLLKLWRDLVRMMKYKVSNKRIHYFYNYDKLKQMYYVNLVIWELNARYVNISPEDMHVYEEYFQKTFDYTKFNLTSSLDGLKEQTENRFPEQGITNLFSCYYDLLDWLNLGLIKPNPVMIKALGERFENVLTIMRYTEHTSKEE